MSLKGLQVLVLITLAAAMLYGQSGPVYYSPTPPDCTSLGQSTPVNITNASGATIGYSCYVAGTFLWLAAGQGWTTSIRVAAPASGAVGVDYFFYDANGNDKSFDTTFNSGSSILAGHSTSFDLYANQPAQVYMLGATGDGPAYNAPALGSAYAVFYCASAAVCLDVLPQLIYSDLPSHPWSLSSPIAWDSAVWTQWSAVGLDNGGDTFVTLAIYNESSTATAYTVRVYDSTGTLAGTGVTDSIPGFQQSTGQAGTYGKALTDIVKTPLPAGPFKILIDGGAVYSAAAVLQFTGGSATALQVAYDSAPRTGSGAATARQSATRDARAGLRPRVVSRQVAQ